MEIKREYYLNKLISHIGNSMVKVITGIRRCGKSYLLLNIFKNYLTLSGVKEENIITIALDDVDYSSLRNPLRLSEYIKSKILNQKEQYFILIDEIQYCNKVKNPDSEGDYITFYDVLNSLLYKKNLEVYVTGSNSMMLSKDILTQFRSRGDEIRIYPLSFSEFLSAKDMTKFEGLEEYYKYGGMPQALLYGDENEKSFYLKNLFKETYIKDIIARNRIKNPQTLEEILDIISSSIGSLTNPKRLENSFLSVKKENVSYKVIANYLDVLCDAFIVDESLRFDVKGKKYINTLKKYYFVDMGLRNALLNFRQFEKSHIMENVIYNELKSQGFNVDVGAVEVNEKNEQAVYQRKQLEIDFVVNKGDKKCYIQSALSINDADKFNQETRSLSKIKDSFKKIIITGDLTKHYVTEGGIEIVNIYDFLLHDYEI